MHICFGLKNLLLPTKTEESVEGWRSADSPQTGASHHVCTKCLEKGKNPGYKIKNVHSFWLKKKNKNILKKLQRDKRSYVFSGPPTQQEKVMYLETVWAANTNKCFFLTMVANHTRAVWMWSAQAEKAWMDYTRKQEGGLISIILHQTWWCWTTHTVIMTNCRFPYSHI